MPITVPSTTVKSKFLKTRPIHTVYKDPRNGYAYQIIEKNFNGNLIKTAVPYLGQEEIPIEIQVPPELLKVENPHRANIMTVMKNKVKELEHEILDLKCQLNEKCTPYDKIKQLMGDESIHETDEDIFLVGSDGIVYYLKKQDIPDEDKIKFIQKYSRSVWKENTSHVVKLMSKQLHIQRHLLASLLQQRSTQS